MTASYRSWQSCRCAQFLFKRQSERKWAPSSARHSYVVSLVLRVVWVVRTRIAAGRTCRAAGSLARCWRLSSIAARCVCDGDGDGGYAQTRHFVSCFLGQTVPLRVLFGRQTSARLFKATMATPSAAATNTRGTHPLARRPATRIAARNCTGWPPSNARASI